MLISGRGGIARWFTSEPPPDWIAATGGSRYRTYWLQRDRAHLTTASNGSPRPDGSRRPGGEELTVAVQANLARVHGRRSNAIP